MPCPSSFAEFSAFDVKLERVGRLERDLAEPDGPAFPVPCDELHHSITVLVRCYACHVILSPLVKMVPQDYARGVQNLAFAVEVNLFLSFRGHRDLGRLRFARTIRTPRPGRPLRHAARRRSRSGAYRA